MEGVSRHEAVMQEIIMANVEQRQENSVVPAKVDKPSCAKPTARNTSSSPMLGPARKTSSSPMLRQTYTKSSCPMLGPGHRAFTLASPCNLSNKKKDSEEDEEEEEFEEGAEFEESEESEESEDRTHVTSQIPIYTVPTENVMDELQTSFDDLAATKPVHVKSLTMQHKYAADEMNRIVSGLSANMSKHVDMATEEYHGIIYQTEVAAEEFILNGITLAHQTFLFRVIQMFLKEFRQFQKDYIVYWRQVVVRYLWQKWILAAEMTKMQNRAFNNLISGFLTHCGTKAEPTFPEPSRIESLNNAADLFSAHMGNRFNKETSRCLMDNFYPAFFSPEPTEQQNAELEEASGAITVSFAQAVENMRAHTEHVRLSAEIPKLHKKMLNDSDLESKLLLQFLHDFEMEVPEKIVAAVQMMFQDVEWHKPSTTEHLMFKQDPGYEPNDLGQLCILQQDAQQSQDAWFEPNDLRQLMLEQQDAHLMLEHYVLQEPSDP